MILLERSQGASRGRLLRWGMPGVIAQAVCGALSALILSSTHAGELPAASTLVQPKALHGATCAEQSRANWPESLTARRARIAELQRLRHLCIDDAAFLALLGAMLLEDGDAEQALVWLERSLLLDPDSLGARVDHALALAALGQPGALKEVADALRTRGDVPPALRARLYPSEQRSVFAWPSVRLGHALRPHWGAQGEISLILTGGYSPTPEGVMDEGGLYLNHPDQLADHKIITTAVRQAGGRIVLQILHAGRYARVANCVAPSALKARINSVTPRALTEKERLKYSYIFSRK